MATMTVGTFIDGVTQIFNQVGIPSARLDTLVLLGDALGRDKGWLLAHPEFDIPEDVLAVLKPRLEARKKRTPLAYVRGRQEFYGRDFAVNKHVLIPRPETEEIITRLIGLEVNHGARMLDVGTGSGAIAITAALEVPGLRVEACDISAEALPVAKKNAKALGADVKFFASDLLHDAGRYDIIAANLPYVGPDWLRSPETNFEPGLALFADDNGLSLIKKLLKQVPDHLKPSGYLLLEADPRQFRDIIGAAPLDLRHASTNGFTVAFKRA